MSTDMPSEVRSNDGLGVQPERAAFESWYVKHVFDLQRAPIGSRDFVLQWEAWQAAKAHERLEALRRLGAGAGNQWAHLDGA